MDADTIGSAAAVQALKISAAQNQGESHTSQHPSGQSSKPNRPSSPVPDAKPEAEEEVDSAPPSSGNPATDKIVRIH